MDSHKRGRSTAQSEHYRGSHFNRETVGTSKYPRTVLFFNKEFPPVHPTQKPVELFAYLIKTYTNEGDLVLDNVAGSGTTGVAAKMLGRNYILIEKEKEYCDIAEARIKNISNTLF